jgi:hypothetical protein
LGVPASIYANVGIVWWIMRHASYAAITRRYLLQYIESFCKYNDTLMRLLPMVTPGKITERWEEETEEYKNWLIEIASQTSVEYGKVHLCTGTDVLYRPYVTSGRVEVYLSPLMCTALESGEGSASPNGHFLPPGKTRYPLYRRLGGPKGRCEQVRNISPSPQSRD